jgi:acyl-CoA synthetase (AMP-forming)/AMP-acid ligase II
VTCLASGIKTVWPQGRFEPDKIMRLIEAERITNWGPMGTMLHRIVHHPDVGRYDLGSIKNIGSGGAPMSEALQCRAREVFPNARSTFGIGYGLTECSLATLNFGAELEAAPDSVGRPLPTTQVEIRGSDGEALAEGREGEIHLRSPLVMKEYWRKPEATAESILPGRWLRTGDVGRIEQGRLYIASRKRDLILRGGENIYPVEIEQCLESHPDVLEAAVVGKEHEEFGQEVLALVVARPGSSPSSEELRVWVSERLAYYKVPEHWQMRDEPLPRNATGKILKQLLVEGGENPFEAE